ncbi:tol-pal system protein YbgF [Oceanibacterium hippocampi]|uniref:Cell division coordinator CpoB n=1 Tax=Oceanibacterium hippocampi TaxID=745714 RepID=A0A1Y5TUK1_9PROT|nr:tol-pal system protein YbgF [Oceanibacterium hippocampi]SLN73303.1 tol-pal system protein YbgF [Oceanibacterium hippocampi]
MPCRTLSARNRPIRILALLLAFALAVVVDGQISPAAAQSSELRALTDRLNRLDRDLADVQRQLYGGNPPPASSQVTAPAPSGLTASGGGQLPAGAMLSQRLDVLEQLIRDLTGRVEENSFRLSQVTTRVDKLVEDVDFRLTAIERNMAAGGGGGMGAVGGTASGQQGSAPGTLGTISPGQLENPDAGRAAPRESAESTPLSGAQSTVANLSGGTPEEQYQQALSLLKRGDYDRAEVALNDFLANNREGELAGNAQYWLGETYYVRQDYPNAAAAFLAGHQNYPDSPKASASLLKLAMTLNLMGEREQSCVVFDQFRAEFPDAPGGLKQLATRERGKAGCS